MDEQKQMTPAPYAAGTGSVPVTPDRAAFDRMGYRERLALNNIPKWMEGFTGAMITAGLMAVAFNGFSGLI